MRKQNPRVDGWRIRSGPLATPGDGMIGNFFIPVGGIGNKSRLSVRAIDAGQREEVARYLPNALPIKRSSRPWEVVLVNVVNSDRQPFGEALDIIAAIWFEDDEEVVQFRPTIRGDEEKLGVVALCHQI